MKKPKKSLTQRLSELPPEKQEELERRRLAAQRLKEALSSIPFYAAKDEAFWATFQASRMLANGQIITNNN